MRKLFLVLTLIAWTVPAFVMLPVRAAHAEKKLTAKQILDRVDDLYRGKSAHGKMTMAIKTEHWQRELKIEFWSRGKDRSLARILSPKKEKGTATLRSGNNIWNYLPKVKRVIKVPSSMMGASWMGSHFTNDDLVKESRMADDYTFKVTFEGKREGRRIVEITCTPRRDAAVVWGRVVVEVTAKNHIPVRMLYYDEDLKLARTMIFSKVKTIAGRKIPTVAKMVPSRKKGEYTELRYHALELDIDVPKRLFTLRSLKR